MFLLVSFAPSTISLMKFCMCLQTPFLLLTSGLTCFSMFSSTVCLLTPGHNSQAYFITCILISILLSSSIPFFPNHKRKQKPRISEIILTLSFDSQLWTSWRLLGIVAYACHLCTWKGEAEGLLWVWRQLEI